MLLFPGDMEVELLLGKYSFVRRNFRIETFWVWNNEVNPLKEKRSVDNYDLRNGY